MTDIITTARDRLAAIKWAKEYLARPVNRQLSFCVANTLLYFAERLGVPAAKDCRSPEDVAIEAASERLKIMYIAQVPSECELFDDTRSEVAWRVCMFEDYHWEMHQGFCALDPCTCRALTAVPKLKSKNEPPPF